MISFSAASQSLLRKYAYWIFAIGAGSLLAIIEDSIKEPFFSMIAFVYWSLLIFWALRWAFKQTKSIIRQQKEKKSTELQHLQSQVNPHFFFNTLNNLYGLVEKDSKKAQELILQLSDMMRYSIYDGQKESVTLEDEVAYLQNFIELHKSRYHKAMDIQLNLHFLNEGIQITPLLFINLLENAFKHGVENLRENAYIHMQLMAIKNEVSFVIENNFDPEELPENPGIGLKNLRRRLELAYPGKHSLVMSSDQNIYKAKLILYTV